MKIVTRFAPSPTGNLHIGGARTALFNYFFTRKNGGTFLLRIEDTDKVRSTKEFERSILDGLTWLGIKADNTDIEAEIPRQSKNTARYKEVIEKLIASGHAYISKETPKEAGDRDEVIRFKNPNKKVSFEDMIRGKVEFDTTDLSDFIIAKSLEEPVFHLTNVVDDIDMGITHIIRGEDHISNTPRQILIWEAIGAPRAIYAHLPLILATDRSKLSKRHGAVSVIEYKNAGYLPESIVNYLALLGWNPGTNQEILSLDEIVNLFKMENVQKGGAIFNIEKLRWINKEYIKKLDIETASKEVEARLGTDFNYPINKSAFIATIIERISIFSDIETMKSAGEFDTFEKAPTLTKEKLIWKKDTAEGTLKHLEYTEKILSEFSDSDWTNEKIKSALQVYAEKEGKGNVLWPLRYALSGKDQSPDPFTLAHIFGKGEALARIKNAIQILK